MTYPKMEPIGFEQGLANTYISCHLLCKSLKLARPHVSGFFMNSSTLANSVIGQFLTS
jgi:hypothetical protein